LGLRFDPMGGGQFKQAVKAIIEAESQPIRTLEAHKAKEQSRLKLFQEFKSKFQGMDKAIQDLTNFQAFREYKVDLGDGQNLASVTVDKSKAQPGAYKIEINDLAARTSVISNGFENPDKPLLGMGFVVFNMPDGDTKEVYVDDEKSSLRGLANAINSDDSSPVRAAVIKDSSDNDEPWRLIMTAKKEGDANQVEIPDFYFMDGEKDITLDDKHDAKNASIKVDGFPIEAESNDINDFLPGVNLHLKQAKGGAPFTMTIAEDTQKMTGKVKGLVDQVNEILGFISKQNSIDEHTDTSTTFAGDTSLTNIEYRLRNLMQEGFPVGDPHKDGFRYIHLNELGIEFDKTGTLGFKEDKFQKALEKDFNGIAEGISGQYGLVFQLRTTIQSYTQSGTGLLGVREKGIRDRIADMDHQIDEKTDRLEKRQQSLTDQFSRLEGSMADMQRQQGALSALGGGGGGGNIVSQLLGG
jgi:flagellar hook-associated protein 2